ncbi:MAG: FtsX-like permease family protein, partial [Candidatus Heimdallarchaeota archaeon]|nr:FtsX-like permease family protein [Candidatus Heimdallarchaeota archaeon]
QLIGIDWKKEPLVTTIKKRLGNGVWPDSNGKNEVIVGQKIASVLQLNLGDELILISQGADGSIANDIFYIKAIFEAEDQGIDDYSIYTDISSAQTFFSFQAIQEVAIKLNHINMVTNFAKSFNPGGNLVIRPWQEVEEEFFRAMEVDKKGNMVGYIIIMIVVALGILNSVLMSILERIKEFGVLKAIGTSPKNLILMIIMEAQFIAIISVILGAILSFFINLYFVKYGISLSEPMTYGGMLISHIFAEITPRCFIQPAFIVFGTTFLVSLYPAVKSARVSPIEALREN